MAKKRGLWADIQRERARRQRLEQQAYRASLQAAAKAKREQARAERAAAQRAAVNERERKKTYGESRKAEAAECAADVQSLIDELDSVLTAGIRRRNEITFESLKRSFQPPPFDPAGLDSPLPGAPQWASFAPRPPGAFGRLIGREARYEREEAIARQAYEKEKTRYEATDTERRRKLTERHRAYQEWISGKAREVEEYNTEIDEFERSVRSGDSDAVARFFTLVLDASLFPEAFPHRTRVIYRPEARELVVEYELPAQEIIPTTRDFRYMPGNNEIKALPRPPKEIKERYARLIAQVTLRVLHDVFSVDPAYLVETASFNGHVSTKDKATGQPIHPCLISAGVSKELFSTFVLTDLDPVACLKRINALVSPHPYELQAVRPMVDFEALLSQYKFVEGIDAVAGLDSRPDLLAMTPTEFEHLTKQLFEAMGMKSWVTQPSKDDGVDAVAVNEDPVFGGVCIIQAKRYSKAVGIESVRALAGVMEDKHATKGILVTTSWVGNDSRAFAARHGRIQLIECEELAYLCKEHLGLDVLFSLPKPPPHRRR